MSALPSVTWRGIELILAIVKAAKPPRETTVPKMRNVVISVWNMMIEPTIVDICTITLAEASEIGSE